MRSRKNPRCHIELLDGNELEAIVRQLRKCSKRGDTPSATIEVRRYIGDYPTRWVPNETDKGDVLDDIGKVIDPQEFNITEVRLVRLALCGRYELIAATINC